ncbi:MAG: hypothetical protein NTX02_09035 [Planctomycetia bacterium]|nr:hypothetical protein [Planctomycetia bacterium]
MTLLASFLCRFAWGMCMALALTPASIVPSGFFRMNLLVILGLATGASLTIASSVEGMFWSLPAIAAVAAWIGSVLWLGDRRRGGMIATVLAGGFLASAGVWMNLCASNTSDVAASSMGVAVAGIVSGLVTGLTVNAMLLGHWYLNSPGMSVGALRQSVNWTLFACSVQLVISIAGIPAIAALPFDASIASLVALRWIAGLAGLPFLLYMTRKVLEIPNTQSATGILYVACLAAIVGELSSQLVATRTHWPV